MLIFNVIQLSAASLPALSGCDLMLIFNVIQ